MTVPTRSGRKGYQKRTNANWDVGQGGECEFAPIWHMSRTASPLLAMPTGTGSRSRAAISEAARTPEMTGASPAAPPAGRAGIHRT